MGVITERLNAMTVTVTSPDAQIKAAVRHPGSIVLGFAPGAYRRYDETTLAHQLSRLAALCMTGYVRGYRAATERETTVDTDHPDPKGRRYREALKEMTNVGTSDQNVVKVRATGMMGWEVRIRPGTVSRMDEAEFCAEAASALRRLLDDHRRRVVRLKDEHFDLGLPRFLRRLPPPPPGAGSRN